MIREAGDTSRRRWRLPGRASGPRLSHKAMLLGALLLAAFAALTASASANAPNPTSIVINSVKVSGSNVTVTVSGTWTWDKRVPSGAQQDCNDTRSGVGVGVMWGDNTANPLKVQNSTEIVYVGDANDNWVHSLTEGTQTVDGPFKPSPSKITESMLGETPDAVLNGFGQQGISTGASTATPTKADSEHWFSSCGPTAQSVVNGQTIGNSNPSEPIKGFPNGTWGPISHTYTSKGPHKICPVMYDPHGSKVGQHAGSLKDVIAGGTGHNGDNSVESNGNTTSCVVGAEVPEPAFEATKEQEIAGSGTGFTTAKLKGELGQTVNYKITVKDTGNTTLALGALSDPKCDSGTISAPSQSSIKPGESAFYTCHHVLTATGIYTNVAVVTGTPPGEPPIMHETNQVEVEVPGVPAFTIKKEQRFEGQSSYTTAKLVGKVGQRVEYLITVKDTGTTPLTLGPLSDPSPKCETGTLVGPSENPINPGESATFTCSRVLPFAGVFFNAATESAEGGGKTITHTSNEVEVEAKEPEVPNFEIKKEQRFQGESAYTTAKLVGKVGQRVEYKITVKDTGNTSLTLSPLSDSKCESGTLSGPSQNPIKPGESATFTCSFVLPSPGVFFNVATETAEGGGKTITHTSNEVEVEAQALKPSVFLGYANTSPGNAGGPNEVPNPWKGSAGVVFEGCGFGGTDSCPMSSGVDIYDAGAIRIDASAATGALSVTGGRVVIGPCTYEPWPGLNVTVQPGQKLVLTQTGKHKCTESAADEQDNFDTSESFLKSTQHAEFLQTGKCNNDGFIPAITLTINGQTTTLNDTGQVLNTGGVDPADCTKTTEFRQWTQIQ